MAALKVSRQSAVESLIALLDSPEIRAMIADLQETRWTGRPGYPIRTMVGLMITKGIFALPTWTRTIRLVVEHEGLREVRVEADEGRRPDLPTAAEREEIQRLRRENFELRRANEILKAASVFFAKELDADRPK